MAERRSLKTETAECVVYYAHFIGRENQSKVFNLGTSRKIRNIQFAVLRLTYI